MTQIPILDLTPQIQNLWDDLNLAIQEVLHSGHFIMGEQVKRFEQEVADYLQVKHAIALNSGTDALVIGLRAMGVSAGDEVITTPFSFFATSECIHHAGAEPVFVDVDPHTYNIDPAAIEGSITARTKAIIPVHLFGQAAAMDQIMALAEQHNLMVLEDVAQAFGGTYQGKMLGTIGQMGAFSFFPSKNLGAYGDGGMLITNDDALAQTARMLRMHGSSKSKYHNEIIGYNSRLDELQAAILRVKLPYVDQWNARRQQIAARYDQVLCDVSNLLVPARLSQTQHVFHQYTIRIVNGQRDQVQAALKEAGIGTMLYYPVPIHKLPVYAALNQTLPVSEQLAAEVLSLPMYPELADEQVDLICQTLKTALA